jgi:hypothetical protein
MIVVSAVAASRFALSRPECTNAPARSLLKPGRFGLDKCELMKLHTTLGRDAIEHAEQSFGAYVAFLAIAKETRCRP